MTLGSTIGDAREAARLGIEDLSAVTSIRVGLLTEMELNNFSHCGGDTYARGHLRHIAVKIGLEPQLLIDLYNEEHSTQSRAIQDLLVENSVMKIPREKNQLSWKIPAVASVTILVAIAVAQIITSNQGSTSVVGPRPVTSQSTSVTPAAEPTEDSSPTADPTPAPKNQEVTLTLTASRGNSYIDIIVDGQRVEKSSIFQGDTKSYIGKNAISIYLSNPAGLDVTYNGKQLAPLGAQNEEVRRTFR
jgi:cytoskeleton protein RodZ